MRVSDWSRTDLTPEQLQYAATDAYVSICVYKVHCTLGMIVGTPVLVRIYIMHVHYFQVSLLCYLKLSQIENA